MESDFSYPPTIDPDGIVPSGLIPIPHGSAEFDTIYSSYRVKIEIEKGRHAPFVTLWNQTYLCGMRAGVLAAKDLDMPVFVVMRVDDEGKLPCGADFSACLVTLQALGADAVGIAAPSVDDMARIFDTVAQFACVPLIAALPEGADYFDVLRLKAAGADIFACSDPILCERINSELPVLKKTPNDDIGFSDIAANENEAFFLGDNINLSEQLAANFELPDKFVEAENAGINTALVTLNNVDDARILAEYALMTRLPLAVHAHDTEPLLYALKNISGRIIIDTSGGLEPEEYETAAERYGAILY